MKMKRESNLLKTLSFGQMVQSLAIFFLAVFSIFGCSPHQKPSDKSLKIGIEAGPPQLDPRLATDAYAQRIGSLLFSRLVRLDSSSQIRGDLAESWEIPGPTRYVFHLRKNLQFSDGSPLTSEDVRFTFESILDPRTASPHRKTFEAIDHIETPDPETVIFYLKKPYAPFLFNLTMGIVSKISGNSVESGPYQLREWIPDEKLVLKSNSHYYGTPARIKEIIIKIIPEDTIREMELQKGSLDFLENALPPDFLPFLEKDSHFTVFKTEGTTYAYLGLNLQDPILSRKKVRQAMAYAINREIIIDEVLKGLGKPATGLIPASHWAYYGDVEKYAYAPMKAKKLLDEAGLILPPGGEPRFKLIFKTSQNDLSKRIGEVIQQQFKEVGIQMEIRTYEWGTFYSDIKSGNFQLYSLRWVGIQDPDIYYDLFHSSSIPPLGANRGHFSNAEIDRLVEEGRVTLDPEKRKIIYEKIQKIISEELPYINLWTFSNVAVLKKGLKGFISDPSGDFFHLKELYWD
ncbi:MAG: ABC transporter substrate-binding protein [Nitrospirae bacterium]|nr:ABC transporter substrate-binding protein [Nitrospirota bacterium]